MGRQKEWRVRRSRITVGGAGVLAALLAGFWMACQSHRPVLIGVSTSPTYEDAARLALEDELAAGPVPGLDTVMLPQAEPLASPAIEAALRLVAMDHLAAVIGHSNSAASLATAPIYNEHRVVQIAPTASAPAYSDAGAFSFRLVPPDDVQGPFLAARLGEMLPTGGRVALIYVNDDYGRGLRKALLDTLDGQRFRVVSDLPHLEGTMTREDSMYVVAELARAAPDVIVWMARGTVLARLLPEIRTRLPRTPILGGDGLATGWLPRVPRAMVTGIQHVAYLDLDGSPALRAFAQRYWERFARPATPSDALTYDAMRLLVTGIRAGARTGPALRAYLEALGRSKPPYEGITGAIAFDPNGDVRRGFVLLPVGTDRQP